MKELNAEELRISVSRTCFKNYRGTPSYLLVVSDMGNLKLGELNSMVVNFVYTTGISAEAAIYKCATYGIMIGRYRDDSLVACEELIVPAGSILREKTLLSVVMFAIGCFLAKNWSELGVLMKESKEDKGYLEKSSTGTIKMVEKEMYLDDRDRLLVAGDEVISSYDLSEI